MKTNKDVVNNVIIRCKNCYKEIERTKVKNTHNSKFIHIETWLIRCYLDGVVLNTIAHPLKKSIICKHCKRPIIKCYRCLENECIGNGYLHVYVYTKDGKKLDIDYNPHNCYYDEFNKDTMAEPE